MAEYTKGKITIVPPFSLIDNEIFEIKGRLVAKCWRKDVAEILLGILNSQPDLLAIVEKVKSRFSTTHPKGYCEIGYIEPEFEKEIDAAITKATRKA